MARRIPLDEDWTLCAPSPYDTDEREALSLPFDPKKGLLPALRARGLLWGEGRSGEWVYLRAWRFAKSLCPPPEPPEGRSERYFLYLGNLRGSGEVLAGGRNLGALAPFAQIELSQALLCGPCELTLSFVPALMQGESALPALIDPPSLVCCYFARIARAQAACGEGGALQIHLHVQAFGEGRVQLRLHLMKGDALCQSLVEERRLQAREQTLRFSMEMPAAVYEGEASSLYTLYIKMERAGALCDSTQLSLRLPQEQPAAPPQFPLLLDEKSDPAALGGLRQLGIEGAAFFSLPPQALLSRLDEEGLCVWLLLKKGQEPDGAALSLGFASHPCARYLGGLSFRFADGSPADGRDPCLFALEESARRLGLVPGHLDGLEALACEETPGYLRALKLYARLTKARCEGKRLGLPLELLGRTGRPSAEEAALRSALSPFGVYVCRGATAPLPGAPLRLHLYPLGRVQGACVLEAQIYSCRGRRIKDSVFTLNSFSDFSLPLHLEAALPWPLEGPPLLRLRLCQNGKTLWSWEEPLLFAGMESASLPPAAVSVAQAGDSCYAVNRGEAAAFGLLCLPGPALKCLLPGEELYAQAVTGGDSIDLLPMEEEHVSI